MRPVAADNALPTLAVIVQLLGPSTIGAQDYKRTLRSSFLSLPTRQWSLCAQLNGTLLPFAPYPVGGD